MKILYHIIVPLRRVYYVRCENTECGDNYKFISQKFKSWRKVKKFIKEQVRNGLTDVTILVRINEED